MYYLLTEMVYMYDWIFIINLNLQPPLCPSLPCFSLTSTFLPTLLPSLPLYNLLIIHKKIKQHTPGYIHIIYFYYIFLLTFSIWTKSGWNYYENIEDSLILTYLLAYYYPAPLSWDVTLRGSQPDRCSTSQPRVQDN